MKHSIIFSVLCHIFYIFKYRFLVLVYLIADLLKIFLSFIKVFCLFTDQTHYSVLALVLSFYYLSMLELLTVAVSICFRFFHQFKVLSFRFTNYYRVWIYQWSIFSFGFSYGTSNLIELNPRIFEFLISPDSFVGKNFVTLLTNGWL